MCEAQESVDQLKTFDSSSFSLFLENALIEKKYLGLNYPVGILHKCIFSSCELFYTSGASVKGKFGEMALGFAKKGAKKKAAKILKAAGDCNEASESRIKNCGISVPVKNRKL